MGRERHNCDVRDGILDGAKGELLSSCFSSSNNYFDGCASINSGIF